MERPLPTPDLLVARHTHRKVDRIVEKTFEAFRSVAEGYGTLSPDELVAIGVNLFMNITVLPLERMATSPVRMRNQLCKELVKIIRRGSSGSENGD